KRQRRIKRSISGEYKCSVCGEHLKDDLLVYVDHTEEHIIEEIRAHHPDWVGKDGACKKCLEYYRSQMQGRSSTE
ncbi:MAG: hypothetical protein KAR32_01305, partial [Candidatus Omnitrophica bacterium]|nr:hypothetical protein [Candidatus Omnitrophota bacterium]